ncbi:MAG: MATE family efflux transporter [Clostridiales bacterium]|nr:MATE family efflux transporter [Clostridiales bacterium]
MTKKHFPGLNTGMMITILALAWPTMLEQLLQTAVQYIDTAMVGSLGTRATAAVGATTTVNWLINSSISALAVGFLSFIARACGANDREGARKAVSQAVLAVLVVGMLFTVLTLSLSGMVPVWMQVDESIRELAGQYFFILYLPMLPRCATIIFGTVLRAAGDTKTPMKIGVLVNLLNVILNFLMIYPSRTITLFSFSFTMPGLGWGVLGAAAASAIAFTAGGIAITVSLWRHPMVSPKGQKIRPDMEILRPCMKVALPNMLQRFGTSLGYVAFAAMINALGEISTAAHTIANTVESAFYIPGYGMQTAAATLAGNAYGAKDEKKMRDLSAMFIPIEIGLMILSGGALFLLAPGLVGLFSQSPEVIRLGSTVLRMVAVSEPFYGFSIIMEGMMQGVGKTKQPFVYNITGMWLVRIVGTFICTNLLGLGLISAWACMIAHNLLLFVLFLRCYIKGSWNPLNQRA